jgi:uncharacterized protein YbaP (TraB family)
MSLRVSRDAIRKIIASAVLFLLCASAAAADNAPFLWQVKGKKATHYLMGSMHLLPDSALPLPAGLDRAYRQAQGVVFETDFATLADPKTQLAMLDAASAAQGLQALIPPALYARLKQRASALQMPLDTSCDPYKAWFCAMTLELFVFQKAGFTPDNGIDQQYYNRALQDGKPIHWLEDPEAHLALFTQMPPDMAQQYLAATLDDQTSSGESPASLLRLWQSGDTAGLAKRVAELKARHPQAYARLLSDRNRDWLPRLGTLLDGEGSQLIITGAAHDVGPDGLPTLLRALGYDVQPVAPAAADLPAGPAPAAAASQ